MAFETSEQAWLISPESQPIRPNSACTSSTPTIPTSQEAVSLHVVPSEFGESQWNDDPFFNFDFGDMPHSTPSIVFDDKPDAVLSDNQGDSNFPAQTTTIISPAATILDWLSHSNNPTIHQNSINDSHPDPGHSRLVAEDGGGCLDSGARQNELSMEFESMKEAAHSRSILSKNELVSTWVSDTTADAWAPGDWGSDSVVDIESDQIPMGHLTENCYKPGQIYYGIGSDKSKLSREDLHIIHQSSNFSQAPRVHEITGINSKRYQPETSAAAMARFERLCSDNASDVSCAASLGSRRNSIPSAKELEFIRGNILKIVPAQEQFLFENTRPLLDAEQHGVPQSLHQPQKRKATADSQDACADPPDRHQIKYQRVEPSQLVTKDPEGPESGQTILSPDPLRKPIFSKAFKEDLQRTDVSSIAQANEDLDDGSESVYSEASTSSFDWWLQKEGADEVVPSMEGFQNLIVQLNPNLNDQNRYLVSRIAIHMVSRYKNLLSIKSRYMNVALDRDHLSEEHHIVSSQSRTHLNEEEIVLGLKLSDQQECSDSPEDFLTDIKMRPKPTLPFQVECQLCSRVIYVAKMRDWCKHILQHVAPFTCTWEDCHVTRMFNRKADWARHENECHRHLEWWICDVGACRQTFYSHENFLTHLVRDHNFAVSKFKTQVAIEPDESDSTWARARQCHVKTQAQPQDEPCRFCGRAFLSWKRLTAHIAKHMEIISLSLFMGLTTQTPSENKILKLPLGYLFSSTQQDRPSRTTSTMENIAQPNLEVSNDEDLAKIAPDPLLDFPGKRHSESPSFEQPSQLRSLSIPGSPLNRNRQEDNVTNLLEIPKQSKETSPPEVTSDFTLGIPLVINETNSRTANYRSIGLQVDLKDRLPVIGERTRECLGQQKMTLFRITHHSDTSQASSPYSPESSQEGDCPGSISFPSRQVGLVTIRIEQFALFGHVTGNTDLVEGVDDRSEGSDYMCDVDATDNEPTAVREKDGDQSSEDHSKEFCSSTIQTNRVSGSNAREGDADEEDNRQRRAPSQKRKKTDCLEQSTRYACPYQVWDPFQDCLRPGPRNPTGGCAGINRLKQHLSRKHMPSYRCQRCWASFDSRRKVGEHETQVERCNSRGMPGHERFMSTVQEAEIENACRSVSDDEAWWNLFRLLIPDMQGRDTKSLSPPYWPYYVHRQTSFMIPSVTLSNISLEPVPQTATNGENSMQNSANFPNLHSSQDFNFDGPSSTFAIQPMASQTLSMPLFEILGTEVADSDYPTMSSTTGTSNAARLDANLDSSSSNNFLPSVTTAPTPEVSVAQELSSSSQLQLQRNHDRLRERNTELRRAAHGTLEDLNDVDTIIEELLDSGDLTDVLYEKLERASSILRSAKQKLQ